MDEWLARALTVALSDEERLDLAERLLAQSSPRPLLDADRPACE